MERFDSIYPFTTENIAGYMKDLDLTNKKIITVTGSADQIVNTILKGATDITTFDINPLTEKNMDLKLASFKSLEYDDFLNFLLYESDITFDYNIMSNLNMPSENKNFWLQQLEKYNRNGIQLRNSKLFNTKYFNPDSKLWQNLYLTKENYNKVKERINEVKIKFINTSLSDLKIEEEHDYMFLSNIADYLSLMYSDKPLESYKQLLLRFQEKINIIYFAYLYDIGNNNPRSEIDDLERVKKVIGAFEIETFRSALETDKEIKDGVLILKRGGI